MNNILFVTIIAVLICSCQQEKPIVNNSAEKPDYAIVVHGGAGMMRKQDLSEERYKLYEDALNKALDIGSKCLLEGCSSLGEVEQTIGFLEDSPLFNAGKGAVLHTMGPMSLMLQ